MKKSSTILLQVVLVLIGIGTLAFMLWEPHIEGRNAHATLFEIYFKDPFLAYAYITSIAFFFALYQTFKVLGLVGQNKTFSQETVRALRIIKYCGLVLFGFIVLGEFFIMMYNGNEDRPPAIFMGLIATVISLGITSAATRFEKHLQTSIEMEQENNLNV